MILVTAPARCIPEGRPIAGHMPPTDMELIQMIHAKGTCCMVGTSRNLDRQLNVNRAVDTAAIEQEDDRQSVAVFVHGSISIQRVPRFLGIGPNTPLCSACEGRSHVR